MDVGRTSQPLAATLRPLQGFAQRPSQAEGAATGSTDALVEAGRPRPLTPLEEQQPVSETKVEQESPVEELQEMVEELNTKLTDAKQTQVKFTVDSEAGGVVVQVVDKSSEEVIRQIPSDEVVSLRQRMAEMRGILFETEG